MVERWKTEKAGAGGGITPRPDDTERSKNLGRDISLLLLQERDMNVTLTVVG